MRSILIQAAGAVMLLSSLAHAGLGWPAMRKELAAAGAPADVIGALGAGWWFGSASMAAFGLVVILSAVRLRRGDRSGIAAIRVIAACYVLFGAAALIARGGSPHFLLFLATGALAGLPTLGGLSRT